MCNNVVYLFPLFSLSANCESSHNWLSLNIYIYVYRPINYTIDWKWYGKFTFTRIVDFPWMRLNYKSVICFIRFFYFERVLLSLHINSRWTISKLMCSYTHTHNMVFFSLSVFLCLSILKLFIYLSKQSCFNTHLCECI